MRNPVEEIYLTPTEFIDSDSNDVIQLSKEIWNDDKSLLENAVSLYFKVRDSILYQVYDLDISRQGMTASETIHKGTGSCIQKSVLLAALCRAVGIPSRLGFADVKNHLTSDRLKNLMKKDIFFWHGYTELYLEGKWVKATPAFNLSLCEKFGVHPLNFDGKHDSIFQESNEVGKKHMEYLHNRGHFDDLPYDEIIECFRENHSFILAESSESVTGSFIDETISSN